MRCYDSCSLGDRAVRTVLYTAEFIPMCLDGNVVVIIRNLYDYSGTNRDTARVRVELPGQRQHPEELLRKGRKMEFDYLDHKYEIRMLDVDIDRNRAKLSLRDVGLYRQSK